MSIPSALPLQAIGRQVFRSQRSCTLLVALCLAVIGLGANPSLATIMKLVSAPIEEEAESEAEAQVGLHDRARVGAKLHVSRQTPADHYAAKTRLSRIHGCFSLLSRQVPNSCTHLVGSGIKLRF